MEMIVFFWALSFVESGHNDDAYNRAENAIGRYQIRYAYWKDSNIPGKHEMCKDPEYSRRVMRAYWKRYCPESLKSHRFEVLARIHNGGPKGHKKKATVKYWKKVKRAMESYKR